ncbi:MAG: hypothetical protein JW934_01585 [Anaerolineae bacterium]|nr:hypothetical protein [Anaerolineae bacterium]
MSIIDALSQGFSTIHRRWWVLLIPVLVDLFLWLGPQAAIAHIVSDVSDVLIDSDLLAQAGQSDPELVEMIRTTLDGVGKNYNLFSSLRVRMLGMPSLLVWGGAGYHLPSVYEVFWIYFLQMIDIPELAISVSQATFVNHPVWQIGSQAILLGMTLLVSSIGVAVGAIYLTWISPEIDKTADPPSFWSRVTQLSGRVLLFWLLRVIALILLGLPFFLFLGLLSMFSANLAIIVGISGMGALTWLSFYGIFFVTSMVVNHTTIWQALWNSLNVVLRNFWPTLGLFVLINLIGGGLTILWQQLSKGAWLTLIGILGNAYVGSSLLAGSLIFYRDRYDRWRERVAQILADTRKEL